MKHTWFIIIPLLISCSTVRFESGQSYRIPDDFFGMSLSSSPLEKASYDMLDEYGIAWTRTTMHWSGVEPKEGEWDFSYNDKWMETAKAAGKKVVVILGFDNSYLYANGKEHRDLAEREIPYFLNYVEQVVQRYQGQVDAWEIWNEPNFLFWKGTDKHFFALSKAAAAKIREIDPNAVILGCSLFRVSEGFVRGMFETGAMENTDGISLHPYASDPIKTVNQIEKLQKILDDYHYTGSIWITEVGYATSGIYFSNVHVDNYPEYVVKTISGLAVHRVRNMLWFEHMDDYNRGKTPNAWNPSDYFGLIYPNGESKGGADRAFILCSRYLRGAEYLPEIPVRETISPYVTSLYFRGADGKNILLLWNNGPGKRKIRLSVSGENLELHSIRTGEITPRDSETTLSLSDTPLFFTWDGEPRARLTR